MVEVTDENSLLIKRFQEHNIAFYGTWEDPLFKAQDIGELLGIEKIRNTIYDFDQDEKVAHKLGTLGGMQEVTMLTEQGLYKVLFISRKPMAKEFQKWVYSIIKEVRLNGSYTMKKQLDQQNQKIQQLEDIIEKKKISDTVKGYIYIAGNAKEIERGIYKVGETINKTSRISSLNTSDSDKAIVYYRTFDTANRFIAEDLIHSYLKKSKFHYNNEFFKADLALLSDVVCMFTTLVNEIYKDSNYQNNINRITAKLKLSESITKEDLQDLHTVIKTEIQNVENNTMKRVQDVETKHVQNDIHENNIVINVNIDANSLKFFDVETYKDFVIDSLQENLESRVLTSVLMNTFEQYTKNKNIQPKAFIKRVRRRRLPWRLTS